MCKDMPLWGRLEFYLAIISIEYFLSLCQRAVDGHRTHDCVEEGKKKEKRSESLQNVIQNDPIIDGLSKNKIVRRSAKDKNSTVPIGPPHFCSVKAGTQILYLVTRGRNHEDLNGSLSYRKQAV